MARLERGAEELVHAKPPQARDSFGRGRGYLHAPCSSLPAAPGPTPCAAGPPHGGRALCAECLPCPYRRAWPYVSRRALPMGMPSGRRRRLRRLEADAHVLRPRCYWSRCYRFPLDGITLRLPTGTPIRTRDPQASCAASIGVFPDCVRRVCARSPCLGRPETRSVRID